MIFLKKYLGFRYWKNGKTIINNDKGKKERKIVHPEKARQSTCCWLSGLTWLSISRIKALKYRL